MISIFGYKRLFAVICCAFSFVCLSNAQSADELSNYGQKIRFGDTEVKRDALFELRNFESESASRVAIPAISDLSDIVRATAASTIVFLPSDEALQILLPLLDDKSNYVRREAAHALGKVKNRAATSRLKNLVQNDKKRDVRTAGITALGRIGDPAAVALLNSTLIKFKKSKDIFTRRAAAHALGEIAQQLQSQVPTETTPESFLPEKYKLINRPKYGRLADDFPEFADANLTLIGVLTRQKEDGDVRREAAFALGEIGDRTSINPLDGCITSPDYYLSEVCKESKRKVYAAAGIVNPDKSPNPSQRSNLR